MAVIGVTPFAVLLWGAMLGVGLVFAYELYAIEAGWIDNT
jgi:hypothetical protein